MQVTYSPEFAHYVKWRNRSTIAQQREAIKNNPDLAEFLQGLPDRLDELEGALSEYLRQEPHAKVNKEVFAGTLTVSSLDSVFLRERLPLKLEGFQRSFPASPVRSFLSHSEPRIACTEAGYLCARVDSLPATDEDRLKEHLKSCRDCCPDADKAELRSDWEAIQLALVVDAVQF